MRKGFNFYRSYYDVAKELKPSDREKFLWALLQKQFEGIEPELDGMSRFAYLSQKHSIDAQVAGYEAKTNTTLGGSVGGSEGGSVQEKEEVEEKVEYTRKRFTPPTLQEVDEYCKHRKNNVDHIKWHNFYEAKGWMVGKNKMKDWKAAVRTWEDTKQKKELRELTKGEAVAALNVPAMLDKLLKDGYTKEQINNYAK